MKKRRILIIAILIGALTMAAVGLAALSVTNTHEPEKNAHHYISRGDTYYQSGEYEMALASYRKALEVEPGSTAALQGQIKSNTALGYTEEALADYETLAAALPEDPQIQLDRVNAMIAAGCLKDARDTLEQLLITFDNVQMDQLYQQMHVSAPQIDLESGTYDSYQCLNITSDNPDSFVYYTTDGSEPTRDSRIYDGSIVISAPDTVFQAKCINHLGYESEVVRRDYTITVPVKNILNRDYSSFAYAVRAVLGKNYNQTVYNYEAAQIKALYMIGEGYYSNMDSTVFYHNGFQPNNYGSRITERGGGNLSKLKYLPYLETLVVCWQKKVSLEPIAQLPNLKNLALLNNNIKDLSALSQLTQLEQLSLGWNAIEDITPLADMKNLVSLGLWNNHIQDITPLSQLTGLQYLDIANNQVTSLDALSRMDQLQEFWANGNQITSIAPLDPTGSLRILMISDNPITDSQPWRAAHPLLVRTDILE